MTVEHLPEPLRWGVLSTAQIGLDHVVPAIQASEGGRIVAIASRDESRAAIEFPSCDQYALQADAFAREARGGAQPGANLDDAICDMRVLDALFRSGRSGGWERP